MKAYIIGEVGSCHERYLNEAKAMIVQLLNPEDFLVQWFDRPLQHANAVKFQYFHSGKDVAARRRAPEYAPLYERYRLPEDWLPILRDETKFYGGDFLCTVYLPEDIAVVAPYVDKFKIASCDALDRKFIEAHLPYNKEILVSTGLLTHDELLSVVRMRAELGRDRIKLLHCVSAYPCPIDEIHLEVIHRYDLDGFSDHTAYPGMGALAYMLGARIFEAHIRGPKTQKNNPDYKHALDPEAWSAYVSNIRMAERVLGDTLIPKQTQPAEAPLRKFLA